MSSRNPNLKPEDDVFGNSKPRTVTILLLGNMAVGKTCLTRRFIDGTYSSNVNSTIAMDMFKKDVTINNQRIKLIVHDTAGQERFNSLVTTLFRRADGAMLVYDVGDRESFRAIDNWLHLLRRVKPDIPLLLVGNKSDLSNHEVSLSEAREMAQRLECSHVNVSGCTGLNVDQAFYKLCETIINGNLLIETVNSISDNSVHLLDRNSENTQLPSKLSSCRC